MFSLRSYSKRIPLQLALILFGTALSMAGVNKSTVRHPGVETGRVLGLAVDPLDPRVLYLATQNGFFRSPDSGVSWVMQRSDSLGRQMIAGIGDGQVILRALGTALAGQGIIQSLDGGQSWTNPTEAVPWPVQAADILLAVDQQVPGVAVYVATVCCMLSPNEDPINFFTWRSGDSGTNFEEITSEVGFADSLAFDNGPSRRIYLASDLGLFSSSDDGQSWEPVAGPGLPEDTRIQVLATDPRTDPALLIAATGSASGQVFVSPDRGESWTAAGETGHRINSLQVDPAVDRSIYYARTAGGLLANFGTDSEWLPLRSLSEEESFTFLALSATAQQRPAALFSVIEDRVEHYQPEYRYLPQVGEGQTGEARLETSFLVANTGGESFYHLDFIGPSGEALQLDLGELGVESSFSAVLERGQSQDFRTQAKPDLRVGYGRLMAGAAVDGTAVFTRTDVPTGLVLYEAGVPLARADVTDFSILVDSIGIRDSGLALVNPFDQQAHLTLRLYDESFQLLAVQEHTLGPFGQMAQFVFELFPGFEQALEMKGILTVQSDLPLAALTLRQNEDLSQPFPNAVPTLTVFPVIPGRADTEP